MDDGMRRLRTRVKPCHASNGCSGLAVEIQARSSAVLVRSILIAGGAKRPSWPRAARCAYHPPSALVTLPSLTRDPRFADLGDVIVIASRTPGAGVWRRGLTDCDWRRWALVGVATLRRRWKRHATLTLHTLFLRLARAPTRSSHRLGAAPARQQTGRKAGGASGIGDIPPPPPAPPVWYPLQATPACGPESLLWTPAAVKNTEFVPRAVPRRRRAAESAARQRRQGAAARAASHWHSAGARASGCPASGTVTFVASVSGRCPGRHAGCHGGLGQEKGCSLCTGFVCGGGGGGGAARA